MADEDFPLALVTGAAHRLGRTFALSLARRGYAILLHYFRSFEEAGKTADEIRVLNVPVYLAQADLTDTASLQSLFTKIDSIQYELKVLVNSASLMLRNDIRTLSPVDWDLTINLNLRAPFLLAQQAAVRMLDGGLIVNISDAGAQKAWTGFPAYIVSKSALESLTCLLAKAFAPKVRVNSIAPGLIFPSVDNSEEEWKRLVERLPLKHPASEEEVAAALEYLLENASVTGQSIVVDGGYSLL
jgi:pteridine reductase